MMVGESGLRKYVWERQNKKTDREERVVRRTARKFDWERAIEEESREEEVKEGVAGDRRCVWSKWTSVHTHASL